MTKQRHCFLTDVGIAIEKLVVALDPECEKPFVGDILDLLEWAEKDVLEMRAEIERLKTVPMKYRRMTFNAQLQDENAQLCQQLAERDAELKRINHALNDDRVDLTITAAEAIKELRQQITLLRDALDSANQIITFEGVPYYLLGMEERDEALTATEPKP